MFKPFYILILSVLSLQVFAQTDSSTIDTIVKYAVSNETKQFCEKNNYETEHCKRYLTNTDAILSYQENLNYFKILNESDELLLEYLAFGYFNKAYCGTYIRYYKNGIVKVKGQYACKTNKNFKKCNLKDGLWSYFNDSGSLIKIETYEKGKLVAVRHI